jgi:pimeloyl-ACP methyl ester carboxylesterase
LATSTFSNIGGREVIDAPRAPDNGVVRALALLAVVAFTLALAGPADAALRFKRCGPFGFSCARLSVPLDRTGAVPGRVSLFVKRIRAREGPRRGALFVLAGGPGESASATYSGDALPGLSPALRSRDLIVFDQRGTGRSGLLRCRALERANLLQAGRAAAECATRLGARRAFYTSRDSADDIEAIRRELGIPRIALHGTSYGTKVALGYAMRYPANVERLALDSVVEAGGPNALYLDALAAVPRALRAVCRSGCSAFTRDAVADVATLVGRMTARPLRGRLVDRRGRARSAAMGRGDLFSVLLAGDFDPPLRAAFPGAVRAALEGDGTPLLRLRRRAFPLDGEPLPPRLLSSALYAATTCEETPFPWARVTVPDPFERRRQAALAAGGAPDTAFFPFDRATAVDNDLIALCGSWPAAPADPTFGLGPLPDVPVLLLEGEDDLRTPVENARRVAAQFPRSSVVVAPATGHPALDSSGCAARAFARFFRGQAVPTRCRRVRRDFPATPPPPTALRHVRPVPSVRGMRGRALAAVALTLVDVAEDVLSELILDLGDPDLARGGGLRAGRYRLDGDGTLHLDGVAFVPGVRLSGRLENFGLLRQRGRLRVGGPATPDGVLSVRRRRATGRLGGVRVSARLTPAASTTSTARARAAAARFRGAFQPRYLHWPELFR